LLSAETQERQASFKIQPDLGVALGHEATLLQVMMNLLANALKYSKLGIAPVIEVRSEHRDNRIRISVVDNGIGIAPEYHKKVFEIFERIPNSAGHSGSGVGLAIVAKSIERLSGTYGVESTPGTGSIFWFELPAVTPVAANGQDSASILHRWGL
jgi:signal transduction histidine kinase